MLADENNQEICWEKLSDVGDPAYRMKLVRQEQWDAPLMSFLAKNEDNELILVALASQERLSYSDYVHLSRHPSWSVRYHIAANISTPPDILCEMYTDDEAYVRYAMVHNPRTLEWARKLCYLTTDTSELHIVR